MALIDTTSLVAVAWLQLPCSAGCVSAVSSIDVLSYCQVTRVKGCVAAGNRTRNCPTDGLNNGQPITLTIFGSLFGLSGADVTVSLTSTSCYAETPRAAALFCRLSAAGGCVSVARKPIPV
jgi:hypothetical protein